MKERLANCIYDALLKDEQFDVKTMSLTTDNEIYVKLQDGKHYKIKVSRTKYGIYR